MWFNFIMIPLLKSPLHSLVSNNTMLVTFTGRKSAKQYELPVNYLHVDSRLLTISFRQRKWWRNLRGGTDVTVRIKGEDHGAIAEVVEAPEKVEALLSEYFATAPEMARYFQVQLDADGYAIPEDIRKAAESRVVVVIRLAG